MIRPVREAHVLFEQDRKVSDDPREHAVTEDQWCISVSRRRPLLPMDVDDRSSRPAPHSADSAVNLAMDAVGQERPPDQTKDTDSTIQVTVEEGRYGILSSVQNLRLMYFMGHCQ